jgi:RNA polymerase-binding transcription factor DksA
MTLDYKHFEDKLLKEKALIEKEMSAVGRQNPDNPNDWEARPPEDRDTSQADENTVADAIEGYEDNAAIMSTLEKRYKDILSGLDKIKHNAYGTCQVCGKEIEADRLEVSPSARTCKEHINSLR